MSEGIVNFSSQIRPIELRKDLAAIADLIELCFSENMDPEGRDYIRHIHQIAGGIGNFFLEGTTPETSQLPFHGYVWEENHKVIGNLTLIPLRKRDKHSYFIANVAVHPDHRNKGIARKLTERAISHVIDRGGKKIFLQVRDDNPSAIHIYQSLGFEEMVRRTTWHWKDKKIDRVTQNTGTIVTRRKSADWEQQRSWLQDLYPPQISWNLPFLLERLSPNFWTWLNVFLNGGNTRSWSVRTGGHMIGTASWESGFTGSDFIWIATSPAWEQEAIQTLLPVVKASIFRPLKAVVNYPSGRGREGFERAGMSELNTLIWMSLSISTVSS